MTEGLLLLLPPSETKRDGGNAAFTAASLVDEPDAGGLAWGDVFASAREVVAAELAEISTDAPAAMRTLKISAKQAETELARNRDLWESPRMAALARYTGVLYDALDAATLASAELRWAAAHVAVHSALFGLVGAGERIPAYRLSASSRLGGVRPVTRWAEAMHTALSRHDGLVVDLRSKAYSSLGPIGSAPNHIEVDVVSRDASGELRSLNHFNKRGKGLFTRAAIRQGSLDPGTAAAVRDANDLATWSAGFGFDVEVVHERLVRLVVDEAPASSRR